LRGSDDRFGREVEGNAENVGIFDVEEALVGALFIQLVGLAAQGAADDLLAQELRTEGADAENMGHRVRVPAFREHRDRDDTADGAAQLARLADGIHYLAKQFLVGDALGLPLVAGPLSDFAAEAVDFIRRHVAETGVERVACFELLAVDEQCIRSREWVAGRLVEVAEQGEAAVLQRRGPVFILAVEAGDEVVHQLGDGRVLADDDEAGRHPDALLFPELEGFLVVAVERLQGRLEPGGKLERVEFSPFAASLLRHVFADILPQVAEDRHFIARYVLRDGDARELDDAAFDRVHEREVAHGPREQRALGVTGAAEKEGGRRQVHDAGQAELAIHRFQAGNPEPGRLVVLLGFLLLLSFQFLLVRLFRLLGVAVVRLVVEHEDVLHAHKVGHHPLEHLALGLLRVQLLTPPLKQGAPAGGEFDALAELEGVIVGNHDFRAVDVVEHVAGDQLAAGVVAVRVVRLENSQAVLDGEARGDDEKTAREAFAAGAANGVNCLPGDQHGHDRGFARAGCQLQGEAQEFGIGIFVSCCQMVEEFFAPLCLWRDLDQPDGGFDGFYLAEEGPDAAERVIPPMLKEAGRFRRHLPVAGVGPRPPAVHKASHLVDDRGGIVLLLPRRKSFALIKKESLLGRSPFPLPRFGNGRDELGPATVLDNLLRWLPLAIEFPMPLWAIVGGVQDRVIEKGVGHFQILFARGRPSAPSSSGCHRL
jgi:hypothetical protein